MEPSRPPQYKIGDKLITNGEEIKHIVGQTNRAGVYLVEGDRIRWEYYADRELPPYVHYAISKYEPLWYTVCASIIPKRRKELIRQIANSLFSALNAGHEIDIHIFFKTVEEHVYYRAAANQSYRYLLGTLSSFGIIFMCILFVHKVLITDARWTPILVSGIFGGIGAILSVLQRLNGLEISRFSPLWYSFVEGVARGGIGTIFGVFFALANQANLVLGSFKGCLYAISTFATIAGVSERFVPELIKNLESSVARKKTRLKKNDDSYPNQANAADAKSREAD